MEKGILASLWNFYKNKGFYEGVSNAYIDDMDKSRKFLDKDSVLKRLDLAVSDPKTIKAVSLDDGPILILDMYRLAARNIQHDEKHDDGVIAVASMMQRSQVFAAAAARNPSFALSNVVLPMVADFCPIQRKAELLLTLDRNGFLKGLIDNPNVSTHEAAAVFVNAFEGIETEAAIRQLKYSSGWKALKEKQDVYDYIHARDERLLPALD